MNSTEYPRFRFGISDAFKKGKQVDYVLGEWSTEEKEAMKVLLRDQRRRIRNKCEEFDMNRSHTEDLSLALPLEQVNSDWLLRDEGVV